MMHGQKNIKLRNEKSIAGKGKEKRSDSGICDCSEPHISLRPFSVLLYKLRLGCSNNLFQEVFSHTACMYC